MVIIDDQTVQLRADLNGSDDGRVYTILGNVAAPSPAPAGTDQPGSRRGKCHEAEAGI
jgi:hypothetical protein